MVERFKSPYPALITALGLSLVAGSAHADETSAGAASAQTAAALQSTDPVLDPALTPPPRPARFREDRRGWFLAGDLGLGGVTYSADDGSNSEMAWFFHLRFGGQIVPRVALAVEFWSDGHGYEGTEGAASTQNTFAITGSYRFLPRAWGTAGIGSATVKGFSNGQVVWEEDGFAFMMGAGFEVFSRPAYSIDLTARMIASGFDPFSRTAFAFGAGASWY